MSTQVQVKQQEFMERHAAAASKDWQAMKDAWWSFSVHAHAVVSKLGGPSMIQYTELLHEQNVGISIKRLYDLTRVVEQYKDSDPDLRLADRSMLVASTRIPDKKKREAIVRQALAEKRSVNWVKAAARGEVVDEKEGYTSASVNFYREQWGKVKTGLQGMMSSGTITGYQPKKKKD